MICRSRCPVAAEGSVCVLLLESLAVIIGLLALNLDGGGTSAMYIGGAYRVGPGRLLPNAIVLTKP